MCRASFIWRIRFRDENIQAIDGKEIFTLRWSNKSIWKKNKGCIVKINFLYVKELGQCPRSSDWRGHLIYRGAEPGDWNKIIWTWKILVSASMFNGAYIE